MARKPENQYARWEGIQNKRRDNYESTRFSMLLDSYLDTKPLPFRGAKVDMVILDEASPTPKPEKTLSRRGQRRAKTKENRARREAEAILKQQQEEFGYGDW